jgi:2'-5' RNA ligase
MKHTPHHVKLEARMCFKYDWANIYVMRLFVSVDLDRNLADNVVKAQTVLRKSQADVKFVSPQTLHFTLKFLGDVDEKRVPEIEAEIEKALRPVEQFRIAIEGLGYFGSPAHMKVLWVDVKEGKRELTELMKKIGDALSYIRRDEHKPATHLTIGRVRTGLNRDRLLEEINSLKNVKIGEMVVKEVRLKSSVLTRQGPVYKDVKVFALPASK